MKYVVTLSKEVEAADSIEAEAIVKAAIVDGDSFNVESISEVEDNTEAAAEIAGEEEAPVAA